MLISFTLCRYFREKWSQKTRVKFKKEDTATTVQGFIYFCIPERESEETLSKKDQIHFYFILISQLELNRQRGSVKGLIWQNSILQNKTTDRNPQ